MHSVTSRYLVQLTLRPRVFPFFLINRVVSSLFCLIQKQKRNSTKKSQRLKTLASSIFSLSLSPGGSLSLLSSLSTSPLSLSLPCVSLSSSAPFLSLSPCWRPRGGGGYGCNRLVVVTRSDLSFLLLPLVSRS